MLNDIALRVDTSELQNVTCHMGSHSVTCRFSPDSPKPDSPKR